MNSQIKHDIVLQNDVKINNFKVHSEITLRTESVDLKVIKLASRMALSFAKRGLTIKHATISDKTVLHFANTTLLNSTKMELRGIFLTENNQLISNENLATGDVNEIIMYPREIILKCLQLSASNFYLIHVNPVGKDCLWKNKYQDQANNIHKAGKNLGIKLLNYYFVSRNKIERLT